MTDKQEKEKPGEIHIPIAAPDEENGQVNSDKDMEDKVILDKEDEKYLDQLLRLQAEFQNYRRRTEKEWAEASVRAKGDLVMHLLPILDDFQRMLQHHKEQPCSLEGVQLIYQKLIKILKDEGLEPIEAIGKEFDPDFHEAIGVHQVNRDQDGLIAEEWEPGYRFSGKLLRPSKVRVGRYTSEAGD